jgi:gamma-glutamyl-gamma-aminobutyrate hydrolase PuuD
MSLLGSKKFFIVLSLAIFQIIYSAKLPVVGIVSIPNVLDPRDPGYYRSAAISATYVKWLEASGAETMVIHPWFSPKEIDEVLTKVNGIVLQGSLYKSEFKKGNPYVDTVMYILLSVTTKEEGKKIPLLAIDDGFLLLHQILSDGHNHSEAYDKYNKSTYLEFDIDRVKTTRLFSIFTEADLNEAALYNLHHQGIHPSAYQENKYFRDFFRITSVSRDEKGKLFVASVEAHEHPVYAVQFRPDAISYLRKSKLDVPYSYATIRAARAVGNFFVENCKENNNNNFVEADHDKYSFIDPYNHNPVFDIFVDNFIYTFNKP